jgi:hypothetical protein
MSKLNKPISHEQVKHIFDVYGGSPDAWPAETRDEICACIDSSSDLQQDQQAALALDKLLAKQKDHAQTNTHDVQALSERIIANLPEQGSTSTAPNYSNLLGFLQRWFIQPVPVVLTVMAIAVFTISIMNTQETAVPRTTAQVKDIEIFEEWAWMDVTDQALPDQNNQTGNDFMDLLELEMNEV